MRLEWFRLELGVELDRHVPGVRWQLDYLDELAVERTTDDFESLIGQRFFVQAVELVTVAMSLVDHCLAVQLAGLRSGLELAGIGPEPHGAAEVVDAEE